LVRVRKSGKSFVITLPRDVSLALSLKKGEELHAYVIRTRRATGIFLSRDILDLDVATTSVSNTFTYRRPEVDRKQIESSVSMTMASNFNRELVNELKEVFKKNKFGLKHKHL